MTPFKLDPSVSGPTEIVTDGARSWLIPASWTPDQAVAYVGAADEEQTEAAAIAEIEADIEACALNPARIIEAKVREVGEKRAERIARSRDRDEDSIYAKALVDFGGDRRVARVRTPEGSIIMRPLTGAECDKTSERTSKPGMKAADAAILLREQLAGSVVHPTRERFNTIVEMFPGLWSTLIEARDRLIDGTVEDAEKKV